ncbi:hypothetical protein JHK82_020200 [Glycine max]|nr:hypothetical protein JHK82_020200 [Glycine max]
MAGQSKTYSNVAISAVNQVHLFVEEEDSLATPTFEVVVTIKNALLDFPSQLIKTVSKFEALTKFTCLLADDEAHAFAFVLGFFLLFPS